MKKIISVLAMALLVIGAAQAQNQVRKMFVRTTDGKIVKIKVADIEDVTFGMDVDLPDVPTTIDEAKAMLVGYWRWWIPIEDDEDVEGVYYIIKEDLKALYCFKVKDSVTGYYAEYAGKYVAYEIGVVTFPSEEDPTTFYLGEEYNEGTNLHLNSFDFYNGSGEYPDPCIRVDPFEYILMDYGQMKNGLMKK